MPEFVDKTATPTSAVIEPLLNPVGKLTPLIHTLTEGRQNNHSGLIFSAKISILAIIGIALTIFAFWFFFKRPQPKS